MCGINKNGNTERRKGEVIMKMKICLIIRENTVLVLSQPRKKGKNICRGPLCMRKGNKNVNL